MTAHQEPPGPVAILAGGRDGQLAQRVLEQAGLPCVACGDAGEFIAMLAEQRATAGVVAEEVLDPRTVDRLEVLIASQPTWSDFPLIVVAAAVAHGGSLLPAAQRLGNVVVLTRPMAPDALASAAATALRARARQLQVKRLLEEQQDTVRRKDDLLMMLAHELRNPLAPVRYAASVLASGVQGPQHDAAVEVIERQVAHMGGVIEEMLEVFRAGRGLERLDLETVQLGSLARVAIAAHALDRAADLRFEEQGEAWVRGDPGRLRRVIDNLVGNALKFTPAGSPIVVRVARDGADAVLEVRDSGTGFAPGTAERLFEPFTQADRSLDRTGGGLGLGLALVRALVAMHGGDVSASSAGAGQGSVFRVRLPIVEPPAAAQPPAPGEEAPREARRVLIAEDNRDAAEVLRMLLELQGHEVSVAYDGREAVAAAGAELPDVVVCDIGLPELDGHDVARHLRANERTRGLRLIAVTGYGSDEDRLRAMDAGFDVHFPKPVDPGLLLAEVGRAPRRQWA